MTQLLPAITTHIIVKSLSATIESDRPYMLIIPGISSFSNMSDHKEHSINDDDDDMDGSNN